MTASRLGQRNQSIFPARHYQRRMSNCGGRLCDRAAARTRTAAFRPDGMRRGYCPFPGITAEGLPLAWRASEYLDFLGTVNSDARYRSAQMPMPHCACSVSGRTGGGPTARRNADEIRRDGALLKRRHGGRWVSTSLNTQYRTFRRNRTTLTASEAELTGSPWALQSGTEASAIVSDFTTAKGVADVRRYVEAVGSATVGCLGGRTMWRGRMAHRSWAQSNGRKTG